MERQGPLRVLELFSGVGGMHWALQESRVPFEVVAAFDINTTANKIYRANFPAVYLQACSIDKLTVSQLEKLKVDAILMSPPCQPFTRVGKKQDDADIRTRPLLHIIKLIQLLSEKPKYILLENVKGFESSQTRELLLKVLTECDFQFQEFLLSPLQFGIPNARLRYYLLAKKRPLTFKFDTVEKPLDEVPSLVNPLLIYLSPQLTSTPENDNHRCMCPALGPSLMDQTSDSCLQQCKRYPNCDDVVVHQMSSCDCHQAEPDKCSPPEGVCKLTSNTFTVLNVEANTSKSDAAEKRTKCMPCGDFSSLDFDLEQEGLNLRQIEYGEDSNYYHRCQLRQFVVNLTESEIEGYLVNDIDLQRFVIMDVCHPAFRKSSCFTRRYGHFVEGAGSVLQMTSDIQAVRAASLLKDHVVAMGKLHTWTEEDLVILRRLQLRYFTPREIANLLCFPPDFDWPSELSRIQLYRVLGNSLNVHVVAIMIRLMTFGDS